MIARMTFDPSWRFVLAFWAATLVLFGLYLAYVQPLKEVLAPDIYLDLRFDGYDHPEALAFYEGLGVLGRGFYMRSTLFDTVWPLMIAVSGLLLARKTFRRGWLVAVLAAGPVAFGLLDLAENICLIAMNWQFPDFSERLVSVSNALTLAKQRTIPFAFGAFLGLPVLAAVLAVARPKTA
ncbi:hypothetical protein FGK63_17095 [Ruegeria sediminis]|uniref:DUF2029 domain-containing protein n=1 Tax=Ruegeria sediminis TaxID=2583820 RepID=A0ABY2WU22_9RHOB|nr:hypothetical protein [Ruegeria sediminis]TMV04800.1 hypothetical protein FGK63_17095 [Ruegeria sediminis]